MLNIYLQISSEHGSWRHAILFSEIPRGMTNLTSDSPRDSCTTSDRQMNLELIASHSMFAVNFNPWRGIVEPRLEKTKPCIIIVRTAPRICDNRRTTIETAWIPLIFIASNVIPWATWKSLMRPRRSNKDNKKQQGMRGMCSTLTRWAWEMVGDYNVASILWHWHTSSSAPFINHAVWFIINVARGGIFTTMILINSRSLIALCGAERANK